MPTLHVDLRGRSLPERIIFGVLLLAVLVLGFFFLVAALIAGAILACVALLRYWWIRRRIEKAERDAFITTEYRVVENERIEGPPAGDDRRG